MMLLRLVVLAVLFYIGWKMLQGFLQNASRRPDGKNGDWQESPGQDILVEDPVCHTLVPKHQAIRLRHKKQTYYFCSETCCDQFFDAPEGEQ